jgi:hypothetical protein
MPDSQRAIRGRWRATLRAALKVVARARRVIARHPSKPAPKPWTARLGIDYAWSHPTDAGLKAAGITFACRYLSPDSKKNLTPAEAKHLASLGIDSVVVWESTANRALAGSAAGQQDAKAALHLAEVCGFPTAVDPMTHVPSRAAIYFAVDFDATPSQATVIASYFSGAGSVLGVERVGVYGGFWAVKRLFDARLVTYGWQTYAWSGGHWDPRAQIQQYRNGVTVGGAVCDLDRAVKPDFGQWSGA